MNKSVCTWREPTLRRRWLLTAWRLAVAGLVVGLFAGCASGPLSQGSGAVYQTGKATYYADKFRGRTTASGDIYRASRLTAAHRRLPFGTRVRVTNQNNGRSVVVRVNDRGPFVGGRIIDLSSRAARQLRMKRAGVVPVTLQVLSRP